MAKGKREGSCLTPLSNKGHSYSEKDLVIKQGEIFEFNSMDRLRHNGRTQKPIKENGR